LRTGGSLPLALVSSGTLNVLWSSSTKSSGGPASGARLGFSGLCCDSLGWSTGGTTVWVCCAKRWRYWRSLPPDLPVARPLSSWGRRSAGPDIVLTQSSLCEEGWISLTVVGRQRWRSGREPNCSSWGLDLGAPHFQASMP